MATKLADEVEIRIIACPICALCGSQGGRLYLGQRDRLFGAPGVWDYSRCVNPDCGLIWLDPMPLPEDMGKAYANYYTHEAPRESSRAGPLKQAYHRMKRGYLAEKFGYCQVARSRLDRWLGKLLCFFWMRRAEVDASVRFLQAMPQGRLLDVGCGSGDWLAMMYALGWEVHGVDFDGEAVRVATCRGVAARCGSVEEQGFPAKYFDAVTLNHVIEHVRDPIGTLRECRRVLKPGGRLVLFTPNCESLGHRLFRTNWRGVEPPRHLYLFAPRTMRELLKRAGFSNASVKTINSRYVWEWSVRLWKNEVARPGLATRVVARALAHGEQYLLMFQPNLGECLAVQTVKT